tara:strand:+ start:3252 stop:4223 length:972 start_codon:yes stop_codon:yes gene_type:complete
MSIIVAGGAGFIGINLINKLSKFYKEIYIIDNFSINKNRTNLKYIEIKDNVHVIECDLSDIKSTKDVIGKIKTSSTYPIEIWHLAANSDIPSGVVNPNVDLKDTFMTTFNLLEVSRVFDIKKFYFASSSAIYGNHNNLVIKEDSGPLMPISNYGAMKLASEAQCFAALESFLDDLLIFRFPNVVGTPATHGVIIDFIKKLKHNPLELKVLGNGTQEKSYLHVDDLVEGMVFLKEKNLNKKNNPIFNLGSHQDTVTVKFIAEEVVKKFSPNAVITYGVENRGWLGDVPKFLYDTQKAKNEGWVPSLNSKESIRKAIDGIIQQIK